MAWIVLRTLPGKGRAGLPRWQASVSSHERALPPGSTPFQNIKACISLNLARLYVHGWKHRRSQVTPYTMNFVLPTQSAVSNIAPQLMILYHIHPLTLNPMKYLLFRFYHLLLFDVTLVYKVEPHLCLVTGKLLTKFLAHTLCHRPAHGNIINHHKKHCVVWSLLTLHIKRSKQPWWWKRSLQKAKLFEARWWMRKST